MPGSAVGDVLSPGFAATPEAMTAQATALDNASTDLDEVSKPLSLQACGTPDVFGSVDAALAHTNFLSHWTAELSVQADAINQVALRVRISAENYKIMEDKNSVPPATPPSSAPGPVGRKLDGLTTFLPNTPAG